MTDLVLEPPIFLGILILGIVYFIVIFNLTKNKRIASFFEKITTYIFFFIISGANFFPFARLDPGDIGDPFKGFLSGLLMLIVYGAFFILFRGKSKQILSNFFLLFQPSFLGIYLGILFFSVFWSLNSIISLKAIAGLLFYSIFAVHFARKYNWQELAKLLRWNYTFIAISSIFMALSIPSIGICRKGLCGGFGHPIDLGNLMALGASLWLLNAFSHSKYMVRSLVLAILCLSVLHFTNSAGALLLFFVLLISILTTNFLKKLNFTQAYIGFVLLLFLFGGATIWLIENLENFLLLLNKDITFSGRIPLWALLIATSIKERLWFGYGYSAFWQNWLGNSSPAANVVNTIIGGDGGDWVVHAHNGFLDIMLDVGLIGLLVFVALFLFNMIQAVKLIINNKRPESCLPIIILTFVFMTNLYNSPIVVPSYVWFFLIMISIRLKMKSRPPKIVKADRLHQLTSHK